MKNLLFNIKFVITGSSKAVAGAEIFWKSEPEWKQIVSAPQHWLILYVGFNKHEATSFPPVKVVKETVLCQLEQRPDTIYNKLQHNYWTNNNNTFDVTIK